MTADVVTVTLNPAIDLTVAVDHLVVGAVHRARSALSNCGGKGINVAGCLADWGVSVAAAGLLGRFNDDAFAEFFAAKGIADVCVRAPGETRTNIKIAELAGGSTTDVNLPGLAVDAGKIDAVWASALREIGDRTPVVLAGSLPSGAPDDTWATMIADLADEGARIVLDTSGAPLSAALGAQATRLPYAVKPNRSELEVLVGRPLAGTTDVVAAARDLVARGVALVVVSLGGEGALFVDAAEALSARLPEKTVLSTVGAGDAMVAGMVAALIEEASLDRLARLSVAFATAKLDRIGPHLGPKATVEDLAARVDVRRID
ncbi:MAG: 1-phosphofructokinase [Phyllobacteriaceae bacterium]|nr:1-phosphofructokinase [Phyllobacteriaceae bacterium]